MVKYETTTTGNKLGILQELGYLYMFQYNLLIIIYESQILFIIVMLDISAAKIRICFIQSKYKTN